MFNLGRMAVVCLAVANLFACDDDHSEGSDGGLDPSPQVQPFATYRIATRAQYPLQAAIPGPAGDVFVLLKTVKTDPAGALVGAAGGVGVPAVDAVYGVVPDVLKSKLNGWINASLRKKDSNGQSLDGRIDLIVSVGEAVLTHFGLETTLVVSSEGPSGATHRLDAMRFFPPPPLSVVSVARLEPPEPLLPPETTLSVALGVRTQRSIELSFGPHMFRLPFGDYAWLGLNGALHNSSGSDLAGLLVLALDCAAMASDVAKECVGPVCVGHKGDLQSLCEAGRAKLIADAEARVRASGFDAMDFHSGHATLTRVAMAEALNNGSWMLRVNNGTELRDVPATFEGAKQTFP